MPEDEERARAERQVSGGGKAWREESDGPADDGPVTADRGGGRSTASEVRAPDLVTSDSAGADSSGADSSGADSAGAAALARARAVARAKGLRPGSKPVRRRRPVGPQVSGSARDGRDPALLGDQLDRLLLDRGWKVDVAVGSVMGRWPAIVGTEVAAHSTPLTFDEGVLTVRADSTAWATQLRLLTSSLLTRLEAEVGADTVVELRIVGPGAPSWVRGLRRAQGPGPRDTYG